MTSNPSADLMQNPLPFRSYGFTLAEMAVVVLLIGILMYGGLKIQSATGDYAAAVETKNKQERIKAALIGYLRANRFLPCPDVTAPVPDGLQDRVGGVPTNACVALVAGVPVVPWGDLGLSRDDVVDGWGNYFTYRVSTGAAPGCGGCTANRPRMPFGNQDWTINTGANAFDIRSLNSVIAGGNRAITISLRDASGAINEQQYNAVAVILSHGKNGFGARTIRGQLNAAPPAANVDEVRNANMTAPLTFVMGTVTDVGAGGGPFDDRVVFMTPADLLQPLMNEGSLRTCTSYCQPAVPGCSGGGLFTCGGIGTATCPSIGGAVAAAGGCTPTCPNPQTTQCGPAGAGCSPAANSIPIGATPATCP